MLVRIVVLHPELSPRKHGGVAEAFAHHGDVVEDDLPADGDGVELRLRENGSEQIRAHAPR